MSNNSIITEKYNKWLKSESIDEKTKAELQAIAQNEAEIADRFSKKLEFGTAGIRGVMETGESKINIYTIARATQGLACYINQNGGGSAAIAYDTRINSELFAKKSAEVLASNGIKVYLFKEPCPTPELSFALRYLKCTAGINITASHNPKQYNGYKVYFSDGAQIGPEQAEAIAKAIDETDIFNGVRADGFDKLVSENKIEFISDKVTDEYLKCVLEQIVNKKAIPSQADDMTVVYTPLHGTGKNIVPEALKMAGLKKLITVPEQMIQDGSFPTVKYPNPEFKESFALGIELAKKNNSELIIATDPDADRMGVMVLTKDGDFVGLTGNQMGALLLDYIITAYKNEGNLPNDAYAVKSIVSTALANEICERNGVKLYEVLTGFKFIGEVIKKHEEEGFGTYLLGFEESYGYLKGTYARDKDAVVASVLVCEMAAYYRSRGMTLYDAILEVYKKYGYYIEKTLNVEATGLDGQEKIKAAMENLRKCAPSEIGGVKVSAVRDYLLGTRTDLFSGKVESTGLPISDVIYYELSGSAIIIRPSGTEPKIKIYVMTKADSKEKAENMEKVFEEAIKSIISL